MRRNRPVDVLASQGSVAPDVESARPGENLAWGERLHLAWGDTKPRRDDTTEIFGGGVKIIITGDPKRCSWMAEMLARSFNGMYPDLSWSDVERSHGVPAPTEAKA